MIKRLLIANRGEIACRVIRSARAMGIYSIVVYSDADANALFVKMADEAWHIGASEPCESYLDGNKILDTAIKSQADAIHPGYGFLSENATFADQCMDADIKFIGPSSNVIREMGSKSASKQLMEKANVPLTPGYHGDDQSLECFAIEAEKIGFPILIKASAGGGGKGMRVVENAGELHSAIEAAQREALSSFGDAHLLLEKYILQPRHIEVQIFCDQQGNALYLNDRDCSVQRRHQKVLEEAPAPKLSSDIRKAMGEAAVACAKQIGYEGAGTVEFLLDANQQFYFMEMNTRLQVEHPVTEMITGLDLVAWQIAVANGEPLPLSQDQVRCNGHAIEARIYAEDPSNDFLPDAGKLICLQQPEAECSDIATLRIDTGITEGDEISIFYDPMIAKVIVWAKNRDTACLKLAQYLQQFNIDGIQTNTGFLQRLISHEDFESANVDTGFIAQHEELLAKPEPDKTLLSAAGFLYFNPPAKLQNDQSSSTAWDSINYWRSTTSYEESMALLLADKTYCLRATNQWNSQNWTFSLPENSAETINEWQVSASIDQTAQKVRITREGQSKIFSFNWHKAPGSQDFINNRPLGVTLFDKGEAYYFNFPSVEHDSNHAEAQGSVTAPMHGKIIQLLAKVNEEVKQGQPLLILEAMKMEHCLSAPADGVVNEYLCKEGDNVESDQVLVDFITNGSDEDEV